MSWGSGVAVSCGIGSRHSSYLVLLWPRLAAVALIQPLAWELPYAVGVALKSQKKKKKKNYFSKCLLHELIVNNLFYPESYQNNLFLFLKIIYV